MIARKVDDKYVIELSRGEMITIISALGWAETLISSDAAFPDYVGRTRPEFSALVRELADSVKPGPAGPG
jgi:hypothetical protein